MCTQHSLLSKRSENNIRIALFGSWRGGLTAKNKRLCRDLVEACLLLGERAGCSVELVTGGCIGIPGYAIEYAQSRGIATTGFFPHETERHHELHGHDKNSHNKKWYTNRYYEDGYSSRSLRMINYADLACVIHGRIGTLSEITMSIEEQLPLAIFESSGGTSCLFKEILSRLYPDYNSLYREKIWFVS